MPSQNNKRLQQTFAPLSNGRGFKKDGPTWRKRFPEAIAVFNIQGSPWGASFYINLGVYFSALGQKQRPLEYQCHVRARLDRVVDDRARCLELLDFERSIPDAHRFAELSAAVCEAAVPWLERIATPAGAKAYLAANSARTPWVTADAREYLGF